MAGRCRFSAEALPPERFPTYNADMKAPSSMSDRRAANWEHAVDFEKELSPTAARALLQVRFAPSERQRMSALLEKARTAKLTAAEQEAVDSYELLGSLIGILHSKARQALKRHDASA
jgi:hypothetical protein